MTIFAPQNMNCQHEAHHYETCRPVVCRRLPCADGAYRCVRRRAYRLLLQLEQSFCHGRLAEQDFSLADSQERCYRESEEPIKHAKTLLFVGNLYEITGNYPAALNN